MSALDTSPESVAAMIAELRKRKIVHRQNNDDGEPYSTHSYDAGPVNKDGPDAADLLAALSAERDALTERCERAERERDEARAISVGHFTTTTERAQQITALESDLAAARATIAEAETRESNLRDASIRSGNEISHLRATIARLKREKAEAPSTDAVVMREAAAKYVEDRQYPYNDLLARGIRRLPLPPSPTADALRVARRGIYFASKTKHANKWKALRQAGVPINSTWIDEAGEGESMDLNDLWMRCIHEASTASALVLYREPDDVLKGGWIELGAALSNGVPVHAIGCEGFTVAHHEGIAHHASVADALATIRKTKEA